MSSCRASGLGRAAATEIVKAEGYVAIFDLNANLGAAVVGELDASRCQFFQTDVGDSASIARSLAKAVEWMATTAAELGGIVCAAGIGLPTPSITPDGAPCDMGAFDRVMRVNVRGSVDLACQALPYWTQIRDDDDADSDADGDRGSIIFVSSMTAFEGQAGMSAYAGSKACLVGLTLPMARDLAAHRIRVVAIAPGLFDTPMGAALPAEVAANHKTGLAFPRRAGRPAEFGALARHIFENVYLNAECIRIDGGELAFLLV